MPEKTHRFAIITRVISAVAAVIFVGGVTAITIAGPDWPIRSYRFNIFASITLLSALCNFVLLFYFARKSNRGEERIWLLLYLAGIALYTLAFGLQELSADVHGALFWGALQSISVLFSPALYLFALAYTNQSERRYPGIAVLLLIVGAIGFFYETFTNVIFINSVKYGQLQTWGWDFRSATGPGVVFLLLWIETLSLLIFFRLISFRRHTQNRILRRQALIFIFAIGVTAVGGITLDLLLPALGVTSLPPFSVLLGTPSALILVYGTLRHKIASVSPSMFANNILAIMQEAVVVTDKDFEILYTNERAQGLLGLRGDQAGKASLVDFVRPDSKNTFQRSFANGQAGSNGLVDIPRVDMGSQHHPAVPIRVTGSMYRLGDTDAWVMALSDITKELQTRSVIEHEVQVRTKELQEARAYLLSSINSLEQGFILLNAKLGVEVMNHAAQDVFKVKQTGSGQIALDSFVHNPDWDADLAKAIEHVLETKRYYKVDAATKDGLFFEIFLSPILLDDHILGVAIVIQDVTEQRILDRSKDEFFSIASHELRTPLTAIRGNMSMIRDYFKDALKDEGLASMITDTHEASVRLIAIVNDFLDSSRLEQGKMQFSLAPLDLQPLIMAVEKDLTTLLDRQKDKITNEGLSKLPKVMADEGRVRQIIYNLLSNAVKYSQDATITVSAEVAHDKLQLRVSDTGKGISPENQKLLFHKFQQAGDNTLTRDDTKGTGLGLYISRLLAKNMHGNVELERSEQDKGSTFVLTLPLAK